MSAPLLTVADVAKRLNCSDDTVRALVARKLIAHVRVGYGKSKPRIRFTPEDVEAYIATQRVAPATAEPPRLPASVRTRQRLLAHLPDAGRYA